METSVLLSLIAFLLLSALGLWIIGSAMSLTKTRKKIIDQELAKTLECLHDRAEKIKDITEIIRPYAVTENNKLDDAINVCNEAQCVGTAEEVQRISSTLEKNLTEVFNAAKGYPELESGRKFLELKGAIADTETKLHTARREYNSAVRKYNRKRKTTPIALCYVKKYPEYAEIEFKSSEMSQAVPKIDFG